MIDYNYNEQEAEWMQQRCGKFTASEIHKLLEKGGKKDVYFGTGAMTYIRTKLAEILTGTVVEIENVPAMDYGNSMELQAVLEFEKLSGYKVEYWGKANPKFFQYTDYSGGSPDGVVENGGPLIEIKCPFTSAEHVRNLLIESAAELKEGKTLAHYAQIQMNLLCTDKEMAYFISYDPRISLPLLRLKYLIIYRDDAFIDNLKERIAEAESMLKELYNTVQQTNQVATL